MAVALGCLLAAQPALADYDAAVDAYNNGNYAQAHQRFRALAGSGDLRAHHYLSLLSDRGFGVSSGSSSGGGGSIESSGSSRTESFSGSASAGRSSATPWNWFQSSVERGSAKRASGGAVVAPSRKSIMATLYFLPADATMIGMQYVARAVNARELEFDLRHASRDGSGLVMGIFALFWWFVIVRLVYGIGGFVVRVVRDFNGPADETI